MTDTVAVDGRTRACFALRWLASYKNAPDDAGRHRSLLQPSPSPVPTPRETEKNINEMKIALILLSCLVGLSYQQRFFWSLPAPISPYVPRFVANNNYPFEAPIIADPEDEPVGRLAQQPRFFLGFNPFFNPFGMGQGIVTWTYTSWMTATATATSAVLQYCIPAASFSTVNLFNQGQQGFPLGNPQIATDYCNRRKRAAILDELELVESINPSQIEQYVNFLFIYCPLIGLNYSSLVIFQTESKYLKREFLKNP